MITWLQDYYIFDPKMLGGGILTDRNIIMEGLKRGHNTILVNPETWDEDVVLDSELVVISITKRFTKDQINIATKVPYVIFNHDYFCRWILHYPMLEKCKKCKYLDKNLYLNSEAMIWMSPAHRDAWIFAFPEIEDHEYMLTPSALDVDRFYSKEKIHNTAVACNQTLYKGFYNVLSYIKEHPEMTFYIYGEVHNPDLYPSNVNLLGRIPYKSVPDVLSDKEYAVHLPSNIQPSERFAVEAIASGCKPVFNENVGIMSYGKDVVELARNSAKNFWDELEKRFLNY